MSTRKCKMILLYCGTFILFSGLSGLLSFVLTDNIYSPIVNSAAPIKTEENVLTQSKSIDETNNPNTNTKSIENFPSPIKSSPIRKVGNYYSEGLEAYLFHPGLDFLVPEGAIIRATHPGIVIFAGSDPILGEKIELDCGDGWSVIYGGISNLRVKEGDKIEAGVAIGQIGLNPGVDGVPEQSQLHYEVWHNDLVQVQD